MKGMAPFLRVVDAEAAAAWYVRLGFREKWRTHAEPLRIGTPAAG